MTCTNHNGTGKPCYSKRCVHQDCRNKDAWRVDTYLKRSCLELPPQWFVTLNFPSLYYGHDVTARIKRFVTLLKKQLPRKIHFSKRWNYDGNHKGYFPHIHMLIRCHAEITLEMVRSAWLTVWDNSDFANSHLFFSASEALVCAEVGRIETDEDVDYAISYFTKHNYGDIQRVKYWQGPMQGGDRSFLADTIKNLMTKKSYRLRYEEVGEAIEASELAMALKCFLRCQKYSTPTPVTCDSALVNSSLLDTSSLIRLHLDSDSAIIVVSPRSQSRKSSHHFILSGHALKQHKKKVVSSNKELPGKPRSITNRWRYSIWPNGP